MQLPGDPASFIILHLKKPRGKHAQSFPRVVKLRGPCLHSRVQLLMGFPECLFRTLAVADIPENLVEGFNLNSAEKADRASYRDITAGFAGFATLIKYRLVAIRKIAINYLFQAFQAAKRSLGSAA